MKTFEIKDWSGTFQVSINPGKAIRITTDRNGRQYDVVFYIGGMAEYDSYNLSYIGKIHQITEKTVTIIPRYKTDEKRRLKLAEFCWRNYNFDLADTEKRNFEESMCI